MESPGGRGRKYQRLQGVTGKSWKCGTGEMWLRDDEGAVKNRD